MYNNIDKQIGVGLLELLLVLTIAAILILMGIRMYENQRVSQNIDEAKQNAQLLLHAADSYYYAYCAQDINGPSTAFPDDYDQYQRADEMLNSSKITSSSLQKPDKYKNQFLETGIPISFGFGTFDDKEMYHVKLIEKPYKENHCNSVSANASSEGQNCFAQTGLWQVQVSACVTAFTVIKEDPQTKKPIVTLPSEATIKSMFDPDEIGKADDCTHGLMIEWDSIPSIHQTNFSDQGDTILSADQREFNQMYRYGPWMQQGSMAEQGSPSLKDKLEYLCQ